MIFSKFVFYFSYINKVPWWPIIFTYSSVFFRVGYAPDNKTFFWQISLTGCEGKSHDLLFLNINILILHYASMQSEINKTHSLKICIASLELENDKIKVENNKIRAENLELKARVVKLEDKQSQNELIKNLLSVSRKT